MTENEIPITMVALAAAIRDGAQVDSDHHYGKSVTFTLPGSGDRVTVWPEGPRPSSPFVLLWRRESPEGMTVDGGKLPWSVDPEPLVSWAITMAYPADEFATQYAPALVSLREHGMTADIAPAEGGVGYVIRIPLPDSTCLTIGGERNLPSRAELIENWHVQHQGIDRHIGVVHHGSDFPRMVAATMRYLQATAARYGGHHPLGAPVEGERHDGPDKLYGLLADLSELRRTVHVAPGGARVVVFDADGYSGATVDVPAEVVARICRLLTVEKRVVETYGG
ncbi:hypothetical protein [Streptomyces sp. 4F14]|uniref:hypothetical protein n=1 Tax=Streptomyces sp. 4F14 TaxID=3394380 RepID=UPI003A892C95